MLYYRGVYMKVRKAVIPVAGFGTRFLTASKVVPKEMFTIVDKPILEILVDECLEAGIEEVMLVIRDGKEIAIKHFEVNEELEKNLKENNKTELYNLLQTSNLIDKIKVVKQEEQLGFPHAIYMAKEFVGNEPFVLCTGDELVLNKENNSIKQLINAYNETGKSILGVSYTPDDELRNYGIIKYEKCGDFLKILDIVEKPKSNAPSNFASNGKYLFEAKIFDVIERKLKNSTSEVMIPDCILDLAKADDMLAYEIQGIRCDTGNKFGFIKANIDYGLQSDEIKDKLKAYLKELVDKF